MVKNLIILSKNIQIQKFVNVKDTTNIYNNQIEEKIYQAIINIIDKKLHPENQTDTDKFPRMPQTGGKIMIFGERNLNLN